MNKKLMIIAVATTVMLIFGGMDTNYLYSTQYMESKSGYSIPFLQLLQLRQV